MIELEIWRRLIGMNEMGFFWRGWLGFTNLLWWVVVYPYNKDREKHLMKV